VLTTTISDASVDEHTIKQCVFHCLAFSAFSHKDFKENKRSFFFWWATQCLFTFCVFLENNDKDCHQKCYLSSDCNGNRNAFLHCVALCNQDMQYRYAMQICNTDTQHRYAIKICNQDAYEDMRYRYAIKNLPCLIRPPWSIQPIPSTSELSKQPIQICNKGMQYSNTRIRVPRRLASCWVAAWP